MSLAPSGRPSRGLPGSSEADGVLMSRMSGSLEARSTLNKPERGVCVLSIASGCWECCPEEDKDSFNDLSLNKANSVQM